MRTYLPVTPAPHTAGATTTKTALQAQGFSLVELSIVLVIIGLLTGGILAGQSLIRAAAMRTTISQITDLKQSIDIFREKYGDLPGDLPTAANIWSAAANGNGDTRVTATGCGTNAGEADCANFNSERAQFFVQLGLAGLGPNYDGSAVLDKGYPSIRLYPDKGMFMSGSFIPTSGSNMNIHLYATGPLYLYMGICNPSYFGVDSNFNDCAIFLPQEAWGIDKKIDDGKPLAGKVLGESYNTTCVSSSEYALTNNTIACNLMIDFR